MKIETVGGAIIAAFILFATGFLALLQGENVNGWRDITEVSWWILGVGASISFAKDYQALSARRLIAGFAGKEIPK